MTTSAARFFQTFKNIINMDRVSDYFLMITFTLLGALIITSSTRGTHGSIGLARTPKPQVSSIIGHPVTISCLSQEDSPLESCRWERRALLNHHRYFVSINQSGKNSPTTNVDNSSEFDCNCTYEYSGVGFYNGDCSITIRNAHEFHLGEWKCLLTGKNGNTWVAGLDVARYEIIHKPYFEEEALLGKLIYNNKTPWPANVTCCANDPDDSFDLNLFLRNGNDVLSLYHASKNDTQFIKDARACTQTTLYFKPKHNGQLLICNATSSKELYKFELTTSIGLSVEFGPILKRGNWARQALVDNNNLELNVTFFANPSPNVSWFLYADKESRSYVEISQNQTKYSMKLYHHHAERYTASIKILNVEREDYRQKFKLRLWNEHGSQEVDVPVRSHDRLVYPRGETETSWTMSWLIDFGVAGIVFISIFVTWIVVRKSNRSHPIRYTSTRTTDDNERETGPDCKSLFSPAQKR